jgi:glycosyltransferase domain-containing protein
MSNNSLSVAIVIPTLNRSAFLIRQLRYYIVSKSIHAVYIGDSSERVEKENLESFVKSIQGQIKIKYVHYPNTPDALAVQKLLEHVTESYACFIADDDFFVPDSLTKCANFLNNDVTEEYSSCTGKRIIFKTYKDGLFGLIDNVAPYPGNNVTSGTAKDRVIEFFNNYYPCHFNVHRTKGFKRIFYNMENIPERSFTELYPCTASVILGKAKVLEDCTSLIRYDHGERYLLPSLLDSLSRSSWMESALFYYQDLAKLISAIDGIAQDDAKAYITKSFDHYLKEWFSKSVTPYGSRCFSAHHIKEQIRVFVPQRIISHIKGKQYFDHDEELRKFRSFIEKSIRNN